LHTLWLPSSWYSLLLLHAVCVLPSHLLPGAHGVQLLLLLR